MKIKRKREKILGMCRESLTKAGIDPDNIWETRFSIDDFVLLGTIPEKTLVKLAKKLRENPHWVVSLLSEGLESGLLFDWETVARTALDNALG